MSDPEKMWGARFQGSLDETFARYQDSLRFDIALAFEDLETNLAWSEALTAAGVLGDDDLQQIDAAIRELAEQWCEGVPDDDPGAEDVHSYVERKLVQKLGDLGKRIHTGRSRNDQVATDVRLWLRQAAIDLVEQLERLIAALVDKAAAHAADPMPGYTHLQRAQPITIGHHALAHVEALGRDRERLLDATARFDRCPLGSGALAGTAFPVDRDALAARLEFHGGPTRNSLDATAARDHLCEVAFACAMAMTHLSRLAEDYIFFNSQEAAFLSFGDAVSTGSSLMPQKRNPDAMELVRGKAAKVQGLMQSLMVLLKGLPLGYDRDLQIDKELLFQIVGDTGDSIAVAALAVEHARFDVARCAAEAERGFLNATDLADLLVQAGVPFREAHGTAGAAVNRAVELGCELQDLPHDEQRRLLPQLDVDLREELTAARVLARRDVVGGTAPHRVQKEAERWQIVLQEWGEGYGELEELDPDGEDPLAVADDD
ncbi:MAG: argininosuccinate lyase [Planctomycetes bacterium]|nr:argininosuccinate lyase [Planctomycetota bacterium]